MASPPLFRRRRRRANPLVSARNARSRYVRLFRALCPGAELVIEPPMVRVVREVVDVVREELPALFGVCHVEQARARRELVLEVPAPPPPAGGLEAPLQYEAECFRRAIRVLRQGRA